MMKQRKTAGGAPLRWKRRRRIASGGLVAESRCGRYRLYDFHDGSFGTATLPYWRPIERTGQGLPRRYRTRRKALAVAERHARTSARKGGDP
jgi:hypothetical protein